MKSISVVLILQCSECITLRMKNYLDVVFVGFIWIDITFDIFDVVEQRSIQWELKYVTRIQLLNMDLLAFVAEPVGIQFFVHQTFAVLNLNIQWDAHIVISYMNIILGGPQQLLAYCAI
jgi:hypothetical protein